MFTGTLIELNNLAEQLQRFCISSENELMILASIVKSPAPYDALLVGLKIAKQKSPIMISIEPNHELSVVGSVQNLAFWVSHFRFPDTAQDGDHHHPESYSRDSYIQAGSLSTIIEIEESDDEIEFQ